MVKHFKFLKWLKEKGGEVRKTKLMVYAKDYRGLHAAQNIEGYDEILSIPIDLTISCTNLEHETEIGKKLAKEGTFDDKWRRFIFPLIYVLEEMQNPDSRYREWFEIIPKTASDHPMFYTAEERAWLQASSALEQLKIDMHQIEIFYNKIVKVDGDFGKRHTLNEFAHYYYLLCSRFFGVHSPESRMTLLVPYADLINTGSSRDRNASWGYNSFTKEFNIRALAPIKANEPVLFLFRHRSAVDIVYVRTQLELRLFHVLRNRAGTRGVQRSLLLAPL